MDNFRYRKPIQVVHDDLALQRQGLRLLQARAGQAFDGVRRSVLQAQLQAAGTLYDDAIEALRLARHGVELAQQRWRELLARDVELRAFVGERDPAVPAGATDVVFRCIDPAAPATSDLGGGDVMVL